MKQLEKNIRKVTPYVPGEQPNKPGMIKLNTNENPYPPSPSVIKKLHSFDVSSLRLYPDPKAETLIQALAKRYNVSPDQVFAGVGSDDVLAMSFLTFFNSGKPILFPDITYSFYEVWAEEFRIPFEKIPLDDSFHIRKEDYNRECGGIIFPNPNAPTGETESLADIEDIVRTHQDIIVIVDEAYIDFGGESALPLVERYPNLLVVQTFSKSRAMAGMRIGYAIGSPQLIRWLNDVKYSFNSYTMSQPALTLGAAALEDEEYFQDIVHKIIATRERMKAKFSELGFIFGDSQSNFLFVTHPKLPAKKIFEYLKTQNIYVRYFDKPRIDNYLRITIGKDEEMDQLVDVLHKYIEKELS